METKPVKEIGGPEVGLTGVKRVAVALKGQ
jgi:hypothetical protein